MSDVFAKANYRVLFLYVAVPPLVFIKSDESYYSRGGGYRGELQERDCDSNMVPLILGIYR